MTLSSVGEIPLARRFYMDEDVGGHRVAASDAGRGAGAVLDGPEGRAQHWYQDALRRW